MKRIANSNWVKAARLALLIPLLSGCVAQRGIDFGHPIGASEYIPLTQIYNVRAIQGEESNPELILLLPPMGSLPKAYCASVHQALLEEMQKYFPAQVAAARAEGSLKEYLAQDNIVPAPGFFDYAEVARIGRLFGANWVIASWVRDSRLHPPQLISIYMSIIDVVSGQAVAEVDAVFNASEQRVVIALADYLQSRRARPYDKTSLDIMLRSPSEYHAFVSAYCSRAISEVLWP